MKCSKEAFLGCKHCSIPEQICTLSKWEDACKLILLERDMQSIEAMDLEFLKTYNLTDSTVDSHKHVQLSPGETADIRLTSKFSKPVQCGNVLGRESFQATHLC